MVFELLLRLLQNSKQQTKTHLELDQNLPEELDQNLPDLLCPDQHGYPHELKRTWDWSKEK